MKPCNVCGILKADEDFALDKTREDGLALLCRACNKEKCKRWYRGNEARKKALSLAYKAEHGHAPALPARVQRERQTARQQEEAAAEPDDWQMIRFSQSEWRFCLQQAQTLDITPHEFVRNLVKDARDLPRRAFLAPQQDAQASVKAPAATTPKPRRKEEPTR